MYLATVTCNRDFQQMLLQAESIQRFLNPCKHVIIINESNPDLDFWNRWLKPYYSQHELVIIPRIEYAYPSSCIGTRDVYGEVDQMSNGWRTQQLQKMLLAYKFEDDYLLLDSKNFFIKPTDLAEWDNCIGSGSFLGFGSMHNFVGTYKKYAELFEYELEYYIGPHTPFKVKREPLVSKCKLGELGYQLFYPEHSRKSASEGIFYSFLVRDEITQQVGTRFIKSLTIWGDEKPDLARKLFETLMDHNIKVVGLHREILSKMTEQDVKIVDFWLNSTGKMGLGFTNKIYPMPRDSHV
jgi:hypothetical protein